VNAIQLVLALLVVVVVLATLARRIHIPYPIVLVLGGLLIGAIRGLPTVKLAPDVVLLLFLPPLVYGTAWQLSIRDLRANLRSVLLLATGLVVCTTVVVAVVSHAAIAGLLSLPAAFVLGAIVSPTDTVAAEAIITRLGVARRVVTVLEGESLINDATGLVAYSFALTAVAHGAFAASDAALRFIEVSAGGVTIGLVVAVAGAWAQQRIGDIPTAITFSLLTPFAAYLPAQGLGLSGVLAVVAAGLYGGWREPITLSPEARTQAYAVWNTVIFVVNGLIFILVGLQLRTIVTNLLDQRTNLDLTGHPVDYSLGTLVWYAVLVCLAVITVRILCVFPATYLPRMLSRYIREHDPYPGWRNVVIIAWTGMRGGVSLAAALALTSGKNFPQSQVNLITFLVFGVILGTLILQGLTLPVLIMRLRVVDDGSADDREEAEGRLLAIRAALGRLSEPRPIDGASPQGMEHLRTYYEKRANHLAAHLDGTAQDGATVAEGQDPMHELRELRRELLGIERRTIIGLRNRGVIGDQALHRLERDLDLEELRL